MTAKQIDQKLKNIYWNNSNTRKISQGKVPINIGFVFVKKEKDTLNKLMNISHITIGSFNNKVIGTDLSNYEDWYVLDNKEIIDIVTFNEAIKKYSEYLV